MSMKNSRRRLRQRRKVALEHVEKYITNIQTKFPNLGKKKGKSEEEKGATAYLANLLNQQAILEERIKNYSGKRQK